MEASSQINRHGIVDFAFRRVGFTGTPPENRPLLITEPLNIDSP